VNDSRIESSDLFVPMPATVRAVRELTPTERLFTLCREDGLGLAHQPGQFVQVSIFGVEEAPISVCSAERDGDATFELCVRRIGRLTGAMHDLRTGGEVGVRGPFGHGFPLDELAGKDLVFIAGGIGLPPMRSLIQYCLARRGDFGRLRLLYGAKRPAELLFRDELEAWRRADDFDVQLIVDSGDGEWTEPVGLITELIPPLQMDIERTAAVLVGPPVMYRFVNEKLQAKGLPPEQVFLSLERQMRCGVGKCGHCMIGQIYCCRDGPVFKLSDILEIEGAI